MPPRTLHPVYLDRLSPCNHACPAGENVQAWLDEAQAGRYRAAWELILRDNPFPAVHGRVCYHPCEDACNRGVVDGAVSIHAIERFIGDLALEQRWSPGPPPLASGKRILVVGAGPSGLSAAWQLARRGHAVSVFDAGPVAGGMMHFGIPKYRLPREVLDAEIARIVGLGVEIQLNRCVVDLEKDMADGRFDAVFLAVGAHLSKRQEIPATDVPGIYDAIQFLRQVESGDEPQIGRRVAIYGGGNTAIDAARTARRLGAEPLIIYRRTRSEMPAHEFELEEALEEGIDRALAAHHQGDERLHDPRRGDAARRQSSARAHGRVRDARGRFARSGGRAGDGHDISPDGRRHRVHNRRRGRRGRGHADGTPGRVCGRRHGAARANRHDGGGAWQGRRAAYRRLSRRYWKIAAVEKRELASFETLRLWFAADAGRMPQPRLPIAQRLATFGEVTGGFDARTARFEAQRCFSCGNCFECDGCFGACPESAIRKLGPGRRYEYDLEKCTGCAICFEQCPCGAIVMVPDTADEERQCLPT